MGSQNTIFKVCFFEKDKAEAIELQVRTVEPSEFPGLVCFKDLILDPQGSIIRPDLAKVADKFRATRSIHVPYHNILYIEEILDDSESADDASPTPKLAVLTPKGKDAKAKARLGDDTEPE